MRFPYGDGLLPPTVFTSRAPLSVAFALAMLTLTSSCGPKRVVIDGQEMAYDQGAAYLYRLGRQAQEAGDLVAAKGHYRQLLEDFDAAAEAPDARAEIANIALAEGGCRAALDDLDRLVRRYPDHPRAAGAAKHLERCRAEEEARKSSPLGQAEQKFTAAATIAEKKEAASRAADAAAKSGDPGAAVRWLLKVYALEDGAAQRQALEAEITELIDLRISFAEVRALLEEQEGDGFPRPVLMYKLARVQYHVRDLTNAKATLEQFVGKYPQSPFADGAKKLLELIAARSRVNVKTIGVLVPVSGKLKAYGDSVLQAVRLASGELSKGGGPEIDIVVRDSKGDAAEAAKAVQDFVTVDGAIAVVGALFRVEAEGAAAKAQELGVPLVTLTAEEGITDVGPFVLRTGLTNAAQVDALVRYAMDVVGMKRFAILYPRHPYGEELLHLFWDRVEAKKGEVRGVQSYAAEETTFTDSVKALVGRDVLELRGDYHAARRECAKQPDSYRRARCERSVVTDLKPIIDFDGLFIPDYPRTIALVAPALAFEDIIVEQDPRYLRRIEKTLGRKVEPVTLMGVSGWNSPQVPEKAGRYVENALFTDGFFPGDDRRETAQFVAEFRKNFNRTPALPEALFYDAIRMVRTVIATHAPAHREAMRQGLRSLVDFPGVTGKMSLAEGGEVKREVQILTIKEGAIQSASLPVEKAPTVPDSTP